MRLFKPAETWMPFDDRPGGGYVREASPADLLAVVRRGVESGTIKGEEAGVYITRMLQRFNPPADMSINEKVAYKEAIHWAWDFLMSEFGDHLVIGPVSDGGSET